MFLAAAPYFESRFESNDWVSSNFQSCIISVFCITSLISMLVLAKLQENASYPRRIRLSLVFDIAIFILLALSAVLFRDVSVGVYFAFLLVMNFAASLATGINQNGVFAYASGFGQERYMQAIMGGQGVAGVLPCIVQIVSVLAVPEQNEEVSQASVQSQTSKSAFAYFGTAVGVAGIALLAFIYLDRRSRLRLSTLTPNLTPSPQELEEEEEEQLKSPKKSIPLLTIFKQVHWMALALFICFAITMVFPVFTTQIRSVRDISSTASSRLFEPKVFVPLAFLFWNVGDLVGRFSLVFPSLNMTAFPSVLFVLSVVRVVFIPLYLLCNVRGQGAVVKSDAFYLFVVQVLFGVTNGYISSSCMMGAVEWVAPHEREATGAFMGLMLVAGLAVGSLSSFFIGAG